jgi:hypothetical protein
MLQHAKSLLEDKDGLVAIDKRFDKLLTSLRTAVATTPGIPDVSIRHEPELKGAFKALKDKGLRFTHYEEHNPA